METYLVLAKSDYLVSLLYFMNVSCVCESLSLRLHCLHVLCLIAGPHKLGPPQTLIMTLCNIVEC